jgi:hypothetical protein
MLLVCRTEEKEKEKEKEKERKNVEEKDDEASAELGIDTSSAPWYNTGLNH